MSDRVNGASPGGARAAVLAVDVGNSKTDVALVALDGRVLGAVRGPTASHQQVAVTRRSSGWRRSRRRPRIRAGWTLARGL